MKVAVFSTKSYDRTFLESQNHEFNHQLSFFEPHLNEETTVLAKGFPAVCVFVHDNLDRNVLKTLHHQGTRLIALRCSGFNNVDLATAQDLRLCVLRVPAYSPHAVAEYTVGLMLTLNRKIYRAYSRVRESNFALEGLMGFDLHEKTVGIIGTGKIGAIVARIMKGFGCHVLGYDLTPNPECEKIGVTYVSLPTLLAESDIVTLHCPLTPGTHHLINEDTIQTMKDGVMVINTSRGAVIDTRAVIRGLKSGKIGYLGLDVYEEEGDLFFEDLSNQVLQDDVLARLLTFPNVVTTAHQAFFTKNALGSIAHITLSNISDFEQGRSCPNEVRAEAFVR